MSFTKYPQEANDFSNSANHLLTNVQNTITGLKEVNDILLSCNSDDLIVTRSRETITNVTSRINKMKMAISSDTDLVKKIANDLENEEKERQLALKRKLEENGDEDEQS